VKTVGTRMSVARFHPAGRDHPAFGIEIDFAPGGIDDLPHAGQQDEFQRQAQKIPAHGVIRERPPPGGLCSFARDHERHLLLVLCWRSYRALRR